MALAALGLSTAAFAQKTKLTVYTAIENEQLEPFKKAFEADNPTIEIAWVRDSTGVMTAKLIAEKDNPRADVIWGLAASSVGLFSSLGMIEPYTPAGAAALKPMFKSGKSPETWVGMDAFLAVVCFNTAEAEKNKKPKPTSWADLTKPDYKDSIVMPNPASSGTGYLTIAGWLTLMGEDAGWKFMDALHQNVSQYLHSGSAPCVQAAKGERLIGIGFDMRGATEKTKGAPIDLIVPEGRPRLGDGSHRHHEGHQEPRGGQEARRLGVDAQGQRALRQVLRHRRQSRRSSRCRPTTRPTARS